MMTATFADVEIGQVRLRCHGDMAGETALRLRVDHLLGSADMQPAGMSPSAVLIVRQLADPLPGRLAPHEPRVRVDRGWEQATRSALASAWQTAARPVAGVVPAGADAVLFDDEASLLALLAADVCAGRVNERWWWQALPRSLVPPPGRLDQLFLRQPQLIPAIIYQIATLDRLTPVVAALAPRQAGSIVVAMLSAYGMRIPTSRPADDHVERASQPAADAGAIWDAWMPPHLAMPGAGREHQCLVGLGLGLFRAPAVIRGAAFQQRLQAWWSASTGRDERDPAGSASAPANGVSASLLPASDMPQPALATSERQSSQSRRAEQPAGSTGGVLVRQLEPLDASERDAADAANTLLEATPAPAPSPPKHDITSHFANAEGNEIDADSAETSFEPDLHGEPLGDAVDASVQSAPVAPIERDVEQARLAFAGGFRTELGRFAYLINVMCRLDLPDCFEDDWQLATTVGPWGTLELLARALAGSTETGDGLWTALAQLAGRQGGSLPGLELVRPEQPRLPEAWPLPDAAAGTWQPSPLTAGLSGAAVEWLRLVVPVVRQYLRLRLGGDDPGPELLRQPGQVYISATHVDVVLPLDAISIPIRIAGLDRDPGWLPDFGRVVKIHFT